MDRFCSTLIVAAAVVLLCMGYVEMMKMRSRSFNGTCGMKSDIKSKASSAKRANTDETIPNRTGDTPLSDKYMSLSEDWPDDKASCTHEEMAQDDEQLGNLFTWDAKQEDEAKFDKLKIDPEKVKVNANTKPISTETMQELPTYSRTQGLRNPMLDIYHRDCDADERSIKFGESCTWFGGTDAYYNARMTDKMCDCLTENCDCAKKV